MCSGIDPRVSNPLNVTHNTDIKLFWEHMMCVCPTNINIIKHVKKTLLVTYTQG